MKAKLQTVANKVSSIDALLGSKYKVEVGSISDAGLKERLTYFTDTICGDVSSMMTLVAPDRRPQCKAQPR